MGSFVCLRCLKYEFTIQIIYALQDPKIAWNFTLAREKVEHRAIRFDGFVEAYYKTINNLKKVCELYKGQITVDIAVKDADNKIGAWFRDVTCDEIDDIVKVEYNKDKLINYIRGV